MTQEDSAAVIRKLSLDRFISEAKEAYKAAKQDGDVGVIEQARQRLVDLESELKGALRKGRTL